LSPAPVGGRPHHGGQRLDRSTLVVHQVFRRQRALYRHHPQAIENHRHQLGRHRPPQEGVPARVALQHDPAASADRLVAAIGQQDDAKDQPQDLRIENCPLVSGAAAGIRFSGCSRDSARNDRTRTSTRLIPPMMSAEVMVELSEPRVRK
jgi:hypothetical protein